MTVIKAGTFQTQPLDVEAVAGTTFQFGMALTSDGSPFPLTGYTVQVVIKTPTPFTLTSGSGLTINVSGGTIVVAIAAASTTSLAGVSAAWYLMLTDGSGNVGIPVGGQVMWAAP